MDRLAHIPTTRSTKTRRYERESSTAPGSSPAPDSANRCVRGELDEPSDASKSARPAGSCCYRRKSGRAGAWRRQSLHSFGLLTSKSPRQGTSPLEGQWLLEPSNGPATRATASSRPTTPSLTDLFVRDSGIAGQANGPLVEGAKVSYDTEPTDKGPTAINVEVL